MPLSNIIKVWRKYNNIKFWYIGSVQQATYQYKKLEFWLLGDMVESKRMSMNKYNNWESVNFNY